MIASVRQAQIFVVAPIPGPRPAIETRPILYSCIGIRHCDRHRRRIQSCCAQFVDPLHDFSSKSILIHPFNQRCEIRYITCRERFYFLKDLPEFFFVELSVKIQTEQIIRKCDLGRHLELLRKAIRGGAVIAFHSIIE